jgi:hypothetical protein
MATLRLLTSSQHRADNDDGDRPPPIARARGRRLRTLDGDREVWVRGSVYPSPVHTNRQVASTLRHAA